MLSRVNKARISLVLAVIWGAALSLALMGPVTPVTYAAPEESGYETEYSEDAYSENGTVEEENSPDEEDLEIEIGFFQVYPGDDLPISGSGFSPDGRVDIHFLFEDIDETIPDGVSVETYADANGDLSYFFTIPEDTMAGNYTLWAYDVIAEQITSASLSVITPDPEDADSSNVPLIEVYPSVIDAGDSLEIYGNNFTPGEVLLKLNEQDFVWTETDEDGYFWALFPTLKTLSGGQYMITAVDAGGYGEEVTEIVSILGQDYPIEEHFLELTANLDTVSVGDILLLTLEGPEEILAEHGAGALVPQGNVEDGWNTAAEFTEGWPELVESGDGYRVYEYVVPEYQPVGPSYNEAGKLAEDFRNVALPGSKIMLNFDSSVTIEDSPDGVIHRYITEPVHLTVVEQGPEEVAENTPPQDDEDENEARNPTLSLDRSEVHLDEFVGEPDDGAGVRHTVEGLESGLDITYTVQGPDSIENFSGEGSVTEDGVMTFVVHGFEHSTPAIYIGDYTTTVHFQDQDGNQVELSAQFTVVGDSAAVVVPAQVEPAQLGTDLAKTGVSNTALVVIAAALLIVGILIAAFARHRRFSRAEA